MLTLKITTEPPAGGSPPLQDAMAKSTKVYPAGRRKVAPVHPGQIIGSTLEDVGLSLRAGAEMMGVSLNALANIVRGTSAISPDMAVRLAHFMKNGEPEQSAEFWMRLQAGYDLWHSHQKLKDDVKKIKPCPRPEDTAAE